MLGFTSSCWICGWRQKSQTTKQEIKGKRFNHTIIGTVIALLFVNVKADGNIFYPAAGNITPFRTFTARTTALYPPPLLHSNHKINISPFGCNHTPPKINSYLFLLANAIKNAIITKIADSGVGSNNNLRSITMNSSATTTTETITTTKIPVTVSPDTTTSTGSASEITFSTSSGEMTITSPKHKINFHQAMFLCILQGSVSSEFICFLSKKLQKWQQKRLCKKMKEKNNNKSEFYEDGNGKDQQQHLHQKQQQHQQQETESAPITIISCINVAVYCLWQLAINIAKQQQLPSTKMYISMYRHAMMPFSLLRIIRRPHTIVSSAFSHNEFFHLFNNMKALILVGTTLAKRMGIRAFSWMYVASAYGSHMIGVLLLPTPYTSLLKFSSLAGNKLKSLLRIPFNYTYSLLDQYSFSELESHLQWGLFPGGSGASGAISALQTFFCLDEFSLLWSKSSSYSNDSSDTNYWKRNLWIFEFVSIIQEIFTLYRNGLDDIGITHQPDAIHFGGYIFGVILYGACAIKQYIGRRFFEKENKEKKI